MSNKVTKKLPGADSANPGGTATFRIPVGQRYHSLHLIFPFNIATLFAALFTEIRLYVNGSVIQRFGGEERDTLNQFDLLPSAENGVLTMSFDRVGMLTEGEQEVTSINTGSPDEEGRQINNMYLEVDISPDAVVTAADLELYGKVSDRIASGAGLLPYIRKEPRTIGGASADYQISDLINPGVNSPDKVALSRVTFVPNNSTNIDAIKVDRNQYNIFERPDKLNRAMQQNGIREPQAGYFTVDTGENGHGRDTVQLFDMNDFRYRLSIDGATELQCISEYFGVLTGN